jgi:hypothetical protein
LEPRACHPGLLSSPRPGFALLSRRPDPVEQFDLQLGSQIIIGFQVHEEVREAGIPCRQLGDQTSAVGRRAQQVRDRSSRAVGGIVDGMSVWPSCRRGGGGLPRQTTVVLDPRPGRIAVTLGLQRGEGVRYPTIEPLGFVLEASPKVETRREHLSVESLAG